MFDDTCAKQHTVCMPRNQVSSVKNDFLFNECPESGVCMYVCVYVSGTCAAMIAYDKYVTLIRYEHIIS